MDLKDLSQEDFPIVVELLEQEVIIPGEDVPKVLLNRHGQLLGPKFNMLMEEIRKLVKAYKSA